MDSAKTDTISAEMDTIGDMGTETDEKRRVSKWV